MNEEEVNQFRQHTSGNFDYLNNNSFMVMRINTSPLLEKIRKDISGKETFFMQDDSVPGGLKQVEQQVGVPLASEEGIMHICNMVEEIVNPHTVQGNLESSHYWDFLPRCREEVTMGIVLNCVEWGIDDKYLSYIIDKLMRLVELFLTRPMGNKERESYQKEFQSKEIIQTNPQNKQGLGSFASGIGKGS